MKFDIALLLAAAAGGLLFAGTAAATRHQATPGPSTPASAAAKAAHKARSHIAPVDINSASSAELTKLPGLGAADAQRVIAGRPYRTKAQLVTHEIISPAQYEAIRSSIFARQPGVPLPATAGRK